MESKSLRSLKGPVLIQLSFLLCFWLIYVALERDVIYQNTMGYFAKNYVNEGGERKEASVPYKVIQNNDLIKWDAAHYHDIKEYGYSPEKAGGEKIYAFFPLFPYVWHLLNVSPMSWMALNYALFSVGLLILLYYFSEPHQHLTNVLLSLSLPSTIIFLMPYTEAFFFLWTTLAMVGVFRQKYWLYFIALFLASLTRPSYAILMMTFICVELFFLVIHRNFLLLLKNTALRIVPLLVGTATVATIQLSQGSGSPFMFLKAQKYWDNVLSVPHHLRDWSHESFGINLTVLIVIVVPMLLYITVLLYRQLKLSQYPPVFDYERPMDYLVLVAMVYLIGNALFILLFRAGSLHCMFRFTLCAPFVYLLLFKAKNYLPVYFEKHRNGLFGLMTIFLMTIFLTSDYFGRFSFAYFGLILMLLSIFFWVNQYWQNKVAYRIVLVVLLLLNAFWTTYLWNSYINDGWIFA